MRKLFYHLMVSLDGFYEGPHHELDWHRVNDEFNTYTTGLMKSCDMLVFGRITYDVMASYWPSEQALKNDPEVAVFMNKMPKVVFSRTMTSAAWNNTKVIGENAAAEMKALKEMPGKDLLMIGSSDLAVTFIESGLIDEFMITVSPVVLGAGKKLFDGMEKRLNLELTGTRTFSNGNVMCSYRPQ